MQLPLTHSKVRPKLQAVAASHFLRAVTMRIRAFLEPLVVINLLLGETWVNRTTDLADCSSLKGCVRGLQLDIRLSSRPPTPTESD
jgi:hypothetical protein